MRKMRFIYASGYIHSFDLMLKYAYSLEYAFTPCTSSMTYKTTLCMYQAMIGNHIYSLHKLKKKRAY